ncbi:hypothetical protein [Ornithinibacillus californiensis]|uniref:hypothetical protein n=1 Tax=Ornithinibacillus californiensis TaxID=161536 RepID=UPI00064DB8F1|nr:hypothetical protein [Ornithinibacillus californiensis]
MSENKDKTPDKLKVELGGMGLYGTTSNTEIAGYMATGDIENAGQIDKGFKKLNEESGASASLDDTNPGDE